MELTDRTFEKEVLHSDIPVVVDFWASWCLPCKAIEESLNELEKEYDNSLLKDTALRGYPPLSSSKMEIPW